MSHPPYTEAEARSRETFLTLMWALSYPGRIHELPGAGTAFALIAETLLDLETSYYSPDDDLSGVLAQSGAKALPVEQAAYQFYAKLDERALADIRRASVGTMVYPDEAATLVIGCQLGSGSQVALRGPGVDGRRDVLIDAVPASFWKLRESACRFPLGWEVYFVDGSQVVGLPRSVSIVRAE